MKLFLASKASDPKTLQDIEKFVGGLEGKKIAYIPTAGNGTGWGHWKESTTWNILQNLKAEITVVQLEDYWNSDPLADLQNKDIIWLAGGQCGYLMYWLRRTQLNTRLKELLDNGTIYIGSSASSMVTASTLDSTEWYIGEIEHGAGVIPGLGWVDFDIYPHYQDELFEQIQKLYKGDTIYLLKDGEAIIIDDGSVLLLGEERIIHGR